MELEEVPCIIQRICAPCIQLSLTASPPLYLPYMCAYCIHKRTKNVCASLTCLLHTADSHGPILFQTPVHLFHLSPSLLRSLRYLDVKNAERMDLTQTWQM